MQLMPYKSVKLFRIVIMEFARPEDESTRRISVSVTTGGGGKAATSAVRTGTVQIRCQFHQHFMY
jgi:hypothetical protein